MATVGERIKQVREARDWTQEKLAGQSGISKSFLSEVENKGKNIGLELLLSIAQALGASVQYLATGEGEEPIVRKPILIPIELSRAAEELHLTHKETMDLLEAYNSVVARRSTRSKGVVSVEDWKNLHKALKNVLKKTYG
jgi:transcriptional regulator with XRE-family HTH domain